MHELNPYEIFELLEACDELDINELIDDLQNYLLIEEHEWIQQNLIYVYKVSATHQSFTILQNFFDKNPKLFLQSDDLASVEKPLLKCVIDRDDLEMNEIDIFGSLIQWGIGQHEGLEKKDLLEWRKEDYKKLKTDLEDVMTSIRFNEISAKDFYEKVKPYRKVINKDLYEELLKYYITDE